MGQSFFQCTVTGLPQWNAAMINGFMVHGLYTYSNTVNVSSTLAEQ